MPEQPVDAVVTWVDGDDPRHREKLNAYLATLGHKPRSASRTRFREAGEFAYCIASLISFAPWLRYIHIVSDEQRPTFLDALEAHSPSWRERVRLVDHREIFAGYEQYLPTFSSRSIGTMLWRIPELAEFYLFLNDDFVLLRPVEREDFFDGKDRLVVRGRWRPHLEGLSAVRGVRRLLGRSLDRQGARAQTKHAHARGAELAGYRLRYVDVSHVPHPQRRSLLARFFEAHPEVLEQNITPRLRSPQQFLADSLCRHLALRARAAVCRRDRDSLTLKRRDYRSPRRVENKLHRLRSDEQLTFLCLQDFYQADAEWRHALLDWLAGRIDLAPLDMAPGPIGRE